MNITTWADLLAALQRLSPEQLRQPAQWFVSAHDDQDGPAALHPLVYFATVGDLFDQGEETRGSHDNRHHPEHHLLLGDRNLLAPDGAIAFDLETGERIFQQGNGA